MKKLWLALLCLSSICWGQQFRIAPNPAPVTVSGTAVKIDNTNGGLSTSFEYVITGAPATVSVSVYGCKRGGTCDAAAETYTGTASSNRYPTFNGLVDYFLVVPSWTGGTNVTFTVNPTISIARGSSSGGGTTVAVNGSNVSTPNFNDTTPAAAAGYVNVKFQNTGSSVSAEVAGGPNLGFPFTNVTSKTITGAQHGQGTKNLIVSCYDNATPAAEVGWNNLTVDPVSYDVVVSFAQNQSGYCTVNGSGTGTLAGGITINSTNGVIPVRTSATSLTDSHLVDSASFTSDSSGNIVANSFSSGGTPVSGTIGFGSGVADPACATSFLLWGSTTTANTIKWCDANSNIRTAVDTASTQTITGKSIAASEINSGTLAVAQGGTNLASGTSGGILGYTASGVLASSVALTQNILVKGGGAGATPTNSLVTDNGTTATYTGTGGYSAPQLVATGSGAGAVVMTQGSAQGHATANTITDEAPAAVTAYENVRPGSASSGIELNSNSSSVITKSFSGDANHSVHVTAQTATKTIYTLCPASAGGCNVAGQYRIVWYFNQGGTACGTPGTGGVTFALSWTDNAGAHSVIALPMNDNGSIAVFGTKFTFQTTNTSAFASGEFNIWSTGAQPIQVTNTYSACGVGTGTWELSASVEQTI